MIDIESMLIVIGVYAMVGIYVAVIHRLLRDRKVGEDIVNPVAGSKLVEAARAKVIPPTQSRALANARS